MPERKIPIVFEKATKSKEHFFFTSLHHLPRREQTFLHYHDVLELGVCLSGSGECLLGSQRIPYKTGDTQVIPPYQPHYNVADTDDTLWMFINIDVPRISSSHFAPDPAFLIELVQKIHTYGVFSDTVYPKLHALVTELSLLLRTESVENALIQDLAATKLSALLIELSLGKLSVEDTAVDTKHTKRLLPALHCVADSLKSGLPPTPKEMADACFMSESHFRRIFTSTMGEAPKNYISRMQARQAASLLVTTSLPITQIASACGFEDNSTFYRCFTRAYGISPRDYRKKS